MFRGGDSKNCKVLLMLVFVSAVTAARLQCKLRGSPFYPLLQKDGDITIGGIFSFHSSWMNKENSFSEAPAPLQCTSLNFRDIQYAQTVLYAVEEINNSTSLLPGVSLGYKIYDSCGSVAMGVRGAMALSNGYSDTDSEGPCTESAQVLAIIGETSSSPCMAIATSIGPFRIPMISQYATCACLSDKSKYPSFLRTIPSDYYQSRALAELVKNFGWTWVGAIRTDDDYGNNGMATFQAVAEQMGICLEYSVPFFRNYPHEKVLQLVEQVRLSTSRIVVAFLSHLDLEVLLHVFAEHNLVGYQWVGTEGWISDFYIASLDRHHLLSGAIGLSIPKAQVTGLKDFILNIQSLNSSNNAIFTELWEALFKCEFTPLNASVKKTCTGQEDLSELKNTFTDMSLMAIFNNVYKGVYAVAHSLHQALNCKDTCATKKQPKPHTMLEQLKKIKFKTKEGEEVFFDANGDPIAKYEIINWQPRKDGQLQFVTVGLYDASLPANHRLTVNGSILWAKNDTEVPVSVCSESCPPGTRKAAQKGKPVCCYDCIPCGEGEISNETDSITCVLCHQEFWSNRQRDTCLKKETEFLSYKEIMGRQMECAMRLLVLLLLGLLIQAQEPKCRLLGQPELPEYEKDGDFVMGGIFSFRTGQDSIEETFNNMPDQRQCKNFNFREFQFAHTVIFAIEEINRNPDLLPGITLGYKIYDDCGTMDILKAAINLVNGPQMLENCTNPLAVQAIIGHSGSTPSIGFARVIGQFQIPVISHFATCACLSNRKEFPSFFRTIPSDYYQSRALAELVRHFGWTWVGAISNKNDYGINGMAGFLEAAHEQGVCIEYNEAFEITGPHHELLHIVDVIRNATSKVIVTFMSHMEIKVLVSELHRQNISGLQWVGSEAWLTDNSLTDSEGHSLLIGSIGFTVSKAQIPGLGPFLQELHPSQYPNSQFLKDFWESVFDCSLNPPRDNDERKQCNGSEHLRNVNNEFTDVSELRFTNNVYKAVYAVAHALDNLYSCQAGQGPFINGTCATPTQTKPWHVLHYLQSVNFTMSSGEQVFFNSNGDSPARYELINIRNIRKGTTDIDIIGYYDSFLPKDQQFRMNTVNINWGGGHKEVPVSVCSESCPPGTRKAVQKGKPVCCYDCVPCPPGMISNTTDSTDCMQCRSEHWSNNRGDKCIPKQIEYLSYNEIMGIVLAWFASLGVLFTLMIAAIFYCHKDSPIVRANNSELSFLLLFSLTLCFLCSLTFIGRPSEWSCMLRHTAFGITFVLCISCVLGKTIVVLMAFRATLPGSNVMKWFGPLQQRLSVLGFTLIQVLENIRNVSFSIQSSEVIYFDENGDPAASENENEEPEPKRHKTLTKDEVDKIEEEMNTFRESESDALSPATAKGLVRKVWFDVQLAMARRGREGNRALTHKSFVVRVDENGNEFLTFSFNPDSKNHKDPCDPKKEQLRGFIYAGPGDPLCPVRSFKKYVSERCQRLLSAPETCITGPPQHLRCMVGLRCYTNHSLRSTAVQQLSKAGLESREIMAVTVHRNEGSLKSYWAPSSDDRRRWSNILTSARPVLPTPSSVGGLRQILSYADVRYKKMPVVAPLHTMILLLFALVFPLSGAEPVCKLLGEALVPELEGQGDLVIGGIFTFRTGYDGEIPTFESLPNEPKCKNLNYREFKFAHTVIFAVEEINKNPKILPQHRLGYRIYNACGYSNIMRSAIALASGVAKVIDGKNCSNTFRAEAIIGHSASAPTVGFARVLGLFQLPVISHFATCPCLSNRKEFPSFFRTIPSDYYQSRALAKLVKHFGWTWVGAISNANDYGINGMAGFVRAAQEEGVCIEYQEAFESTDPGHSVSQIVDMIRNATSKVIVTFMSHREIRVLVSELHRKNISGLQWVGSEAWLTDNSLTDSEGHSLLIGSIGFTVSKAQIPGLGPFLQELHPSQYPNSQFFKEFWESVFDCSLNPPRDNDERKQCNGSEHLRNVNNEFTDVSELRFTNNVYKAVYAVAHALDNLYSCQAGQGPFINGTCATPTQTKPWQILQYLQQVNFTTKQGDNVYFDSHGDSPASYDLINIQSIHKGTMKVVTIGQYNAFLPPGQQLQLRNVPVSVCSESCPPGTRKAVQKGKPVCCYQCVPCGAGEISNTTDATDCLKCPPTYWSNWKGDHCLLKTVEFLSYTELMGILLTLFSLLGATLTILIAAVFCHFRHTPIVKANNSELSFLLLFSLTLCFLCSLTFIGRPSEWSCMLRHTAFGITFVLCISCVLGKTIVVLMAFRATLPGSNVMKWFGPLQQRLSVLGFTLIQVLICVLWLTISPPFPYQNMSLYQNKIILECNLGSAVGFWAVLGYIGLLATLCFFLAFLARKLPDNFNEAKFITFSMLIFCAVWITFIPAYVSSPGKFTVAVEIFAILASSFGLVFCIFIPKCYVIICRPHENTRKHIMQKNPQ
ncbi:hypothetical protein ACEWY4_007827 [Coilia grayii]|uniref:G-protein coupled receptors family 3 profile domain-containing protein n=1 Tax=Coilia grayii TaxID=363190 RepID=A0ABD1K9B2_9TELE